jgi:hypothetical protein
MWDILSQLLSTPNRELILNIATIVSSSVLVITVAFSIKSYNKMRMTFIAARTFVDRSTGVRELT